MNTQSGLLWHVPVDSRGDVVSMLCGVVIASGAEKEGQPDCLDCRKLLGEVLPPSADCTDLTIVQGAKLDGVEWRQLPCRM